MKINEDIIEMIQELNLNKDDVICYLITLYYGYNPSYIPDVLKIKLNTLKIYEVRKNILYWNIPLFKDQITAFDWVKTEYCDLFKKHNPERAGNVKESIIRLQKLFAKNPDIRKDDVINATKMYLLNTDYKFIRFPHYFIEKGIGTDKTYDLLEWIEKYKLIKEQEQGRNTVTNTMQ